MRAYFVSLLFLSLPAWPNDDLANHLPEEPNSASQEGHYPLVRVPPTEELLKELASLVSQEILQLKRANRQRVQGKSADEMSSRLKAHYQLAKKVLEFRTLVMQGAVDPSQTDVVLNFLVLQIKSGMSFDGGEAKFLTDNEMFYYSYVLASIIEMQKELGILTTETVDKVGSAFTFYLREKWRPKMEIKKEVVRHFTHILIESQGKIPSHFWGLREIPEFDPGEATTGEVHFWAGQKVRDLDLLTLDFDALVKRWLDERHPEGRELNAEEAEKLDDRWRRAAFVFADLENSLDKSFDLHPFKRFLQTAEAKRWGLINAYKEYHALLEARELSFLERFYRRDTRVILREWSAKWEHIRTLRGGR